MEDETEEIMRVGRAYEDRGLATKRAGVCVM